VPTTIVTDVGWWQSTLAAWSQLSDGTQGVIIGAVITGVGTVFVTTITTLIANRHARTLQRSQFKFDGEERKAENLMQIRREVYLQAADALVGLTSTLGRGINFSEPDEPLNAAAQAFGAAIARVQVAGTPETAVRAAALARVATAQSLQFITERIPLRSRQGDIATAASMRDEQQRDVDRLIELMRNFNLELSTDELRWKAIQRQMEFAVKQRDKYSDEWSRLLDEQSHASLKLMLSLPERMQAISEASGPLLESIRLELGNESASEQLREEFKKGNVEARTLVAAAVDAMQDQLAKDNVTAVQIERRTEKEAKVTAPSARLPESE
jgi:hypothetical protein